MSVARRTIDDLFSRPAPLRRSKSTEGIYDTERMSEAVDKVIPSLFLATKKATPNGEDYQPHKCVHTEGTTWHHYSHVQVTGLNGEGLTGRCKECGKEIVGFMDRLKADDLAYFTRESDIPPSWVT